jgi:G:T-mismatch repair DNA endonuclease (very short patch repair protein)
MSETCLSRVVDIAQWLAQIRKEIERLHRDIKRLRKKLYALS